MSAVAINLRVEIKPREDGKGGFVGFAKYGRASVLAYGATTDEVSQSLILRLGDVIAMGGSR